jgi:hypothetical protein
VRAYHRRNLLVPSIAKAKKALFTDHASAIWTLSELPSRQATNEAGPFNRAPSATCYCGRLLGRPRRIGPRTSRSSRTATLQVARQQCSLGKQASTKTIHPRGRFDGDFFYRRGRPSATKSNCSGSLYLLIRMLIDLPSPPQAPPSCNKRECSG